MSELQQIYDTISAPDTKMGELKKLAKQTKTNHELAMALWAKNEYLPRLFATLVVDKKLLDQTLLETLASDLSHQTSKERNHIMEWLMANQLVKSKKNTALILQWQQHSIALLRRTFWYYQARLRWAGQTPPEDNGDLLDAIENSIMEEVEDVQWMMNFTAAWIGIFDQPYRERCIQLGEKTGLYKEEKVSKGCTPSYLPKFIEIEVGKRQDK